MARQFSIDLDERSMHFLEQQLATGRYGSIDLQLLEDRQSLREALIKGENSGVAGSIEPETHLVKKRAERQRRQDEGRW